MSYNTKHIDKKEVKPVNPLIFQTAADLAATFAEVALSDNRFTRGKYVGRGDKPIKMFVADHLEKFIPLAISYLLEMLKPTSNIKSEVLKQEIFAALTDPINDPELMLMGKKKDVKTETEQMVLNAIRSFDKNKIGNISTQSILHMPVSSQPTDLKSTTALK